MAFSWPFYFLQLKNWNLRKGTKIDQGNAPHAWKSVCLHSWLYRLYTHFTEFSRDLMHIWRYKVQLICLYQQISDRQCCQAFSGLLPLICTIWNGNFFLEGNNPFSFVSFLAIKQSAFFFLNLTCWFLPLDDPRMTMNKKKLEPRTLSLSFLDKQRAQLPRKQGHFAWQVQ